MAVLGKPVELPQLSFHQAPGESEHEKAFDALQAASDAAGERGEVAGRLIRFQVADGYAYYLVAKVRPLTLRHIDFIDGYEISAAHIRGLRLADVRDQLDRADRIRALFAAER